MVDGGKKQDTSVCKEEDKHPLPEYDNDTPPSTESKDASPACSPNRIEPAASVPGIETRRSRCKMFLVDELTSFSSLPLLFTLIHSYCLTNKTPISKKIRKFASFSSPSL